MTRFSKSKQISSSETTIIASVKPCGHKLIIIFPLELLNRLPLNWPQWICRRIPDQSGYQSIHHSLIQISQNLPPHQRDNASHPWLAVLISLSSHNKRLCKKLEFLWHHENPEMELTSWIRVYFLLYCARLQYEYFQRQLYCHHFFLNGLIKIMGRTAKRSTS